VCTCFEVNHLISLELGGSNGIKNLWPQPYYPQPGAREKDIPETAFTNKSARAVTPIDMAQHVIVQDRFAGYQQLQYTGQPKRESPQ
jgi:hypothetical protein